MKKIDEIQIALTELTSSELYKLESWIKNLKNIKWKEEAESRKSLYLKRLEARERAKEKLDTMKPTITKWVLENIKVGDILTCKGYNGHKRVIEITSNNVYASCGSFRKGEFIHNGCASNTSIYNITGIFLDGKFQKIKDLIKK